MGRPVQYEPPGSFVGATTSLLLAPGADHIGEVQAWNVDTGKRVWTHPYPNSPNWGPMLATGGGVVFSGGTNDRLFHAFDAANGKLLWQYPRRQASSASRRRSRSTGSSKSPCSRDGASTHGRCRVASTLCVPANSPRCPRAARSGSSPSSDVVAHESCRGSSPHLHSRGRGCCAHVRVARCPPPAHDYFARAPRNARGRDHLDHSPGARRPQSVRAVRVARQQLRVRDRLPPGRPAVCAHVRQWLHRASSGDGRRDRCRLRPALSTASA